jgi:hypothetical protein
MKTVRPPRIAETIPQFGQEPGPFGPIDETPVKLSLTVKDGTFRAHKVLEKKR